MKRLTELPKKGEIFYLNKTECVMIHFIKGKENIEVISLSKKEKNQIVSLNQLWRK